MIGLEPDSKFPFHQGFTVRPAVFDTPKPVAVMVKDFVEVGLLVVNLNCTDFAPAATVMLDGTEA